MPQNNQPVICSHTIKCCHHCVPPKRHTACWGHCPDYAKERAEYDAKKAIENKKRKVSGGIYCQKSERVTKAIRKHGR